MLRRRWPVVALIAWSAFVWVTRIRNATSDNELSSAGKVTAVLLSLSVLAAAAAAAVVLVRARGRVLEGVEAQAIRLFAGWTTAVWAIRAVQIVLADHGVAFKIVHLVLAAVSVGLAALSWKVAGVEDVDRSSTGTAVSPAAKVGR